MVLKTRDEREPFMEYELLISGTSPESDKIVALMGYAQIPHQIRVQNALTRLGVGRRATGPGAVPTLRRGAWAISGSKEIARYIMERTGEPLLPQGAGALLAWLLEDFADAWVTLWMMHFRWSHREDAELAAEQIGQELLGGIRFGARILGQRLLASWKQEMRARGIRRENDEVLRASAARCLQGLEAILSSGPPYLFGGYPTVADFAFFGPLSQFRRDPTGRVVMRSFPAVRAYVHRLEGAAERPASVEIRQIAPRDVGELQPLFGELIGTYWPILVTNYRARALETRRRDNRGVSASLLDGGAFLFLPSEVLQRRLEAILALIDETYARQDTLFGVPGLRMERALVRHIAELSKSAVGRQLLRSYPHLGLH